MTIPPTDAVCGCDCGCMKPLTAGNAMEEDVTHEAGQPWEQYDGPPIRLLICAACYVGDHRGSRV